MVVFNDLMRSAGDFQDIAEETGAGAEQWASYAVAAAGAGVSMESIAGASIKLTKSLVGVDDESKAAGAALAALGIDVQDFKKLDPAAQYEAVGKALAGVKDNAVKTAIAVALFGKSGAEQLKVFKQLEEQGGRLVILTQRQIELADAYSDAQNVSREKLKLYVTAIATEALPAITSLQGVLIDLAKELLNTSQEASKLGAETAVGEWAEEGALFIAGFVDSLRGAASEIRAFVSATKSEFANLKVLKVAVTSSPSELGDYIRNRTGPLADALAERNAVAAQADKDYAANASFNATKIQDALKKQFKDQKELNAQRAREDRGFDPRRQAVFEGATKPDKKAKGDNTSEAERYLESLTKQIDAVQSLSIYEKALAEVQSGRLKGLTPALEAQILTQAKALDQAKQVKEFRDGEVASTTKLARARLDELDSLVKNNESLQAEIDLMGLDADALNAVALQKTRVARAEKELTLSRQEALGVADEQLQVLKAEIAALTQREKLLTDKSDRIGEIAAEESAKKAGDNYRDTLSESIADGLLTGFRKGQSFTDIFINELKAQFAKTVLMPLIRPAVDAGNTAISDILKAIGGFIGGGSYSYNGGVGTTNAAGISGGRAIGGPVSAGETYLVGERGPELLHMGRDGNVIPNSELGRTKAPNVQIHNYAGAQIQTRTDDKGDLQVIVEAAAEAGYRRGVSDIASGTGPMSMAMRTRGGTGPGNLPKRG